MIWRHVVGFFTHVHEFAGLGQIHKRGAVYTYGNRGFSGYDVTTTRYVEKFVTIHLDAMNADDAPDDGWPRAIFDALKALDVSQVAYVPDAGHKQLIEMAHADAAIKATTLTTEQEGIGLSAGAWLGGERTAVLMQSSGVGNCANALASVTKACQFPLLMLVTMRGEAGEGNPWQIPMGEATGPL